MHEEIITVFIRRLR